MTVTRTQYIETLGCSDSLKIEKALDRAYQQRTFEIEHYWKRATFFWGFQAAIFVAFGFVWKEPGGPEKSGILVLSLSSLGILTAIANYLSARGSKFWQENWEKHIDMLEDAVEGRLYKTVWLSKGMRQYSVSKVNLKISLYFVGFWVFVACYCALQFLDWHLSAILTPALLAHNAPLPVVYVAVFVMLNILGVAFLMAQTTGLEGTIPNSNGERGERPAILSRRFARWRRQVDSSRKTILLRRDAPDGQ